eukprot:4733137-Pleurochrysis_carterae.AAC.1
MCTADAWLCAQQRLRGVRGSKKLERSGRASRLPLASDKRWGTSEHEILMLGDILKEGRNEARVHDMEERTRRRRKYMHGRKKQQSRTSVGKRTKR